MAGWADDGAAEWVVRGTDGGGGGADGGGGRDKSPPTELL